VCWNSRLFSVGHDGSGGGAAWYLDKVEIDCPSLGRRWLFPCGRWLGKGEDDGLLERELLPQEMATEEYIPCKSCLNFYAHRRSTMFKIPVIFMEKVYLSTPKIVYNLLQL
jgi:hypothetical protein